MKVNSKNVGRIAERIAMNELEVRGFHIIDLAYMSKTSANVDFIASKDGRSFNVQVKGASNPDVSPTNRWWVQYGYCDEAAVNGERSIFNSKSDFALMADVYYRQLKASGGSRQPGKIWTDLEPALNPRKHKPTKELERALLKEHWDAWDTLGGVYGVAE